MNLVSNKNNITDAIHGLDELILLLQGIHDEHWAKVNAKGTTSKRISRVLSILRTQFEELDDLEPLIKEEMNQ